MFRQWKFGRLVTVSQGGIFVSYDTCHTALHYSVVGVTHSKRCNINDLYRWGKILWQTSSFANTIFRPHVIFATNSSIMSFNILTIASWLVLQKESKKKKKKKHFNTIINLWADKKYKRSAVIARDIRRMSMGEHMGSRVTSLMP